MRVAVSIAAIVGIALAFVFSSHVTYAASTSLSSSASPTKKVRRLKRTITVKHGDYLYKLARAYDTTVRRLFYANKKIKDPDLIYPGEELVVPSSDAQLAPRPWPGDPPAKAVLRQSSNTDGDSDDSGPQTEAATTPPPEPVLAPVPVAATSTDSGSVWDSLAECESSGNWSANTGNGFYGGLQFTLESWQAVGGTGYPSNASRAEQIALAQKLLAEQGWNAWPACSSELGL